MKPSIIFFDYGNVICKDPTTLLRQYLAKKFALPQAVVGEILREECAFIDIDAITEQTFWKRVIKKAQYKGSAEEFKTVIEDIYYPNLAPDKRVLNAVDKAKQKGIRTGILSNISQRLGNYCAQHHYYAGFEPVILSYRPRIRKPDQRIFKYALEQAGVTHEKASLIDDKKINVDAARACGWGAALFDISKTDNLEKDLGAVIDSLLS